MPTGVAATGPGLGASATETALAGFVLAGGRSSRMGRDKALLELAGEPLLVRMVRMMTEAAGSAVILGDPKRYGGLGFPVMADRIAGLGPLGGLLTALESTAADWNLMVACDMPGVTAALLREIVTHARMSADARCVAAVSGRGPEPLCAAYHRSCLAEVQRAVEERRLRMRELLTRL